MTTLVFRDTAATGRRAVFKATLAADTLAGATSFSLPAGIGAHLPTLTSGQAMALRFGTDDSFDPVIVIGPSSGDTRPCQPIESAWPAGTLIVAAAMAEVFESFIQGAALPGLANSSNGTNTGSIPLLLRTDVLPAGAYNAPVAYMGVLNGVGTASVTVTNENYSTVYATVGPTSAAPSIQTASAGFTLSAATTICVWLVGSLANTIATVSGYSLVKS